MEDTRKSVTQTVTEYGGFARSSEGDYKLLFTTEMSELLCRQRTVEEAARINRGELGLGRPIKFDVEDTIVKTRTKETILHPWQELEKEKTETEETEIELD
jgi:hypothetical protein